MPPAPHFGRRQFHAAPAPPPRERRRLSPLVGQVAVAFVLGGLALFGLRQLPPPAQWLSVFASGDAGPAFAGERIGRAETAPLLNRCVSAAVFGYDTGQPNMPPATVLNILNGASRAVRVTALLGAPDNRNLVNLALNWGKVADCVYQQNSWNFCDIDNRALAVDAANSFLRHAEQALADPEAQQKHADDLNQIARTRDRVVDNLTLRLRDGELIGSDFGVLAPAAVHDAVARTKPRRNGCRKE